MQTPLFSQQHTLPQSKESPYNIYMRHIHQGKNMTEEQKKQIQEKLFKQSKKQPIERGVDKQDKMKKQTQVAVSKSSLYKMSLQYILN